MLQVKGRPREQGRQLTIYSCQPEEASIYYHYARKYGIELSLKDQPVSMENAALAAGSRCISISHAAPVTPSTLNALYDAGVRYISTRSIGCDHIDIKYAEKIGICVGNVSYSPDSVADFTMMLMLMASRHFKSMMRRTDAQDYHLHGICGRELKSLTVGVAGTGRIGSTVINRLNAFGCRILAYDQYPNAEIMPLASYVDFSALLAESDILSLHLPATEKTYHLINRDTLACMKRGALLVNTGRGSLVDSYALIDAIEAGRIGGAALDVIENESGTYYHNLQDKPVSNRALALLKAFPNVIITPHTAFYTDQAMENIIEDSIKNCCTFIRQDLSFSKRIENY